jgi:hypothetical protein
MKQVRVLKHRRSGVYIRAAYGTKQQTSILPVQFVDDDADFWAVEQSSDGRGTVFLNLETKRYLDLTAAKVVAAKALTDTSLWVIEVAEDRSLFLRHMTSGFYLSFNGTTFAASLSKIEHEAFVYEDVERRILKEGTGVFVTSTKDPRVGVKMEVENNNIWTLKLRSDFSTSKNLKVVPREGRLEGDNIALLTLNPGERKHFVDLQVAGTPSFVK